MEKDEEKVTEEYLSSLADLNVNSKPLINMLTILAEENIRHAPVIVKAVQHHISKVSVDVKLPVLYLIDSIVKNVKREYVTIFSHCIVYIFCGVFKEVDEKIREKMYTLRQTWNDVFASQKLYALDVKVNSMDPNWPITAKPTKPSIHVNPDFLKKAEVVETTIQEKKRELLEMQKRKLELELEATKQKIKESETRVVPTNLIPRAPVVRPVSTLHQNRPIFHSYGASLSRPSFGLNAQNNYGPQLSVNVGKVRVNPVNPALIHSATIGRDPRLIRQQQHSKELQNTSNLNEENILGQKLTNRHDDRTKCNSNYDQYNRSKHGNSKNSRNNNKKTGSSKSGSGSGSDRDKTSPIRLSSQKSAKRNSSSTNRNASDLKSSFEKKDLSSRSETSTKTSKKESNFERIGHKRHLTLSPNRKSSSGKYTNNRNSRKLNEKTPPPSPKNMDSISNVNSPEKRLKLNQADIFDENLGLKSIGSAIRSTINNEVSQLTNDLDQNIGMLSTEDTDLRQLDAVAVSLADGTLSSDRSLTLTNNIIHMPEKLSEEKLMSSNTKEDIDDKVEVNKRPSYSMDSMDQEPVAKKSKSGNIDTLFGSEDVDLRKPISNAQSDMVPPPPPIISSDNDNWSNIKISPTKSTLEDVRAKLAKAAKYHDCHDKSNKKESNRKFKAVEYNDDSQDGNEDNIRTIIGQAQELLAHDNINNEQYQALLKTVIQINENSKLKEAKRLESLVFKTSIQETESIIIDDDSEDVVAERLAKEAVFKKRIPKLPKDSSMVQLNKDLKCEKLLNIQSSSPLSGETDSIIDSSNDIQIKEKRVKSSKWSSTARELQNPIQIESVTNNCGISSGVGASTQHGRTWFGTRNNQLFNPRNNSPSNSGRMSIPSPWQNPQIIFSNQPPQIPIQQQNQQMVSSSKTPQLRLPSNSIDNPQTNLVRSITIDGISKEIRIYDDVAIVFMEWDQPREIGFKSGQRRIWIDDQEPITLSFNEDDRLVMINGEAHKIRFGFPSRELYINNDWYECFFGGRSIQIQINGKPHALKAEGPPPQVHIGKLRHDLVIGKINVIIDARIIIPVFLDAKVQSFELDGQTHTIQFVDLLKKALINNEPIPIEYGGLPKRISLGGVSYFVRFAALPSGIAPGRIKIKDMICTTMEDTPTIFEETPPVIVNEIEQPLATSTSNSEQINLPNTDVPPSFNDQEQATNISEQISEDFENEKPTNLNLITPIPPAVLKNLKIDELFQKLLSTGILNTESNNDSSELNDDGEQSVKIKEKDSKIEPIDLRKPESIKKRQSSIIHTLYSGMQCSSCGVRFPPEQTIKYSQHLDWHFRQNRRDRDSSRKAHSRKFYYELSDWIQYEEIEDLEEREKNWFEAQDNVMNDNFDDTSNNRISDSPEPSCSAGGPDNVNKGCDVCHEKFDHFYNEDLEEWHLRSAVRIDDKIYHPICYEDYKSAMLDAERKSQSELATDDNAVDNVIIKFESDRASEDEDKRKDVTTIDEDDDDVIVIPMEEPSITEIPDDEEEEYIPVNIKNVGNVIENNIETEIETNTKIIDDKLLQNELMDTDIEIQEPHIPFTDLDTYEERPINLSNIEDSSQSSLLNVKIKEEPKDEDEEEDDGFEDVGTFLTVDDDVSIHSSDNPAQQTVLSSPLESLLTSTEFASTTTTINDETTMDGNVNLQDNLLNTTVSVNKIKINITKSIVTNNTSNSSKNSSLNQIEPNHVINNSSHNLPASVLCGGDNQVSINITSNFSNNNDGDQISREIATSTISSNMITTDQQASSNCVITEENSKDFTIKTLLKNIDLRQMPKVNMGLETSGLCSIM